MARGVGQDMTILEFIAWASRQLAPARPVLLGQGSVVGLEQSHRRKSPFVGPLATPPAIVRAIG
jgi:hypothetical protein